MTLFDSLVDQALKNQPALVPVRIVVEKELLHHDILRILSEHKLLSGLTFMGGTCLRACYGGVRLSEDLDFTGGADFTRDQLSDMGYILMSSLQEKYGLCVKVSEPLKDIKNVDTWKLKVETRPEHTHLPAQRIHIDICAVPSYEKRPMLLLNPYGVDMGTTGLILQAQSREEIFSDKLLAFALRPNRIKHRDLWDMLWLHQQSLKPHLELVPKKLQDRKCSISSFIRLFIDRRKALTYDKSLFIDFSKEMQRFLPQGERDKVLNNDALWGFITYLVEDLERQMSGLE